MIRLYSNTHYLRNAGGETALLCRIQKILLGPNGGFANIYTFGFLFTVGLTTLLILVNVFLGGISNFVGRFSIAAKRRY